MRDQIPLARKTEQTGFAALGGRDVPLRDPEFGDLGQIYDPWTWLAYVAGQTESIALFPAAIVLPLRHPLHTAKAAASVDRLTGGRLVLGIASGDRPVKFPAFGVNRDERGAVFREQVEYLKAVWGMVPRHAQPASLAQQTRGNRIECRHKQQRHRYVEDTQSPRVSKNLSHCCAEGSPQADTGKTDHIEQHGHQRDVGTEVFAQMNRRNGSQCHHPHFWIDPLKGYGFVKFHWAALALAQLHLARRSNLPCEIQQVDDAGNFEHRVQHRETAKCRAEPETCR